ncbi:hypothetical protein LOTGIDRAFT_159401 [Lottia gigantea]|uniref:NADP-dependent oxidoreductase domain-containing protein n=1 Tax=Lottia gigantea TaxID=225164 RepID=V4A0Q0_LOTGI|nr:hypothetical protein LOTGIDRAFT_159401 [Lottia gigantea]ESO97368.1 hypothetical protein LOTGIDRAFT_159401 [Lottia gigantea]
MASLPGVSKTILTGGLEICRILNGMWQVSGAHGHIDVDKAVNEMIDYYDAGLTTFDMADIYGPAEVIYGRFLAKLKKARGEDAVKNVQGLSKFVPRPGPMTRQFHWWDYNDERYLEAMKHLQDLKTEGLIGEVSLTNFDTARMMRMKEEGINLSSNQVQYSLVDMRPSVKMADFCVKNNIKLLTYGTLCGGLLSEKYLNKPEPTRSELNTASLSKYKRMIDTWGGWALFQELLQTLDTIAKQHNVKISNIATRYILDEPGVGGVIIGCRLGVPGCQHINNNLQTFHLKLTQSDRDKIECVIKKGQNLMSLIGDCGDEYR